MATQSERREATWAAIVKAAKRLFGDRGFAGTNMDNVATSAHVAKGAVYHHFETKEALFEAVFDEVSEDLVAEVDRAARSEKDALAAMAAGTQAYFAACAKDATGQIILRDGPAVLGWERWREIDEAHFGALAPAALGAAMESGLIRTQPVEPLAGLRGRLSRRARQALARAAGADRRGLPCARASAPGPRVKPSRPFPLHTAR